MKIAALLVLAFFAALAGCASTEGTTPSVSTPAPAEGVSCATHGEVAGPCIRRTEFCARGGWRPYELRCIVDTWRCIPDTTQQCPAPSEPVQCARGDYLGDCRASCPDRLTTTSGNLECVGGKPTCLRTGNCPEVQPDAGMTPDGSEPDAAPADSGSDASDASSFDPTVRQLATSLCEQPRECLTGNQARLRGSCSNTHGPQPWNELGYVLSLDLPALSTGRVYIAPRLSAGDPRDSFRVEVRVDSGTVPTINRLMTVAEIESGLEITIIKPVGIWITFHPAASSIHSRALQWDLPVGSVRDGRGGRILTTCLQAGSFVLIPQHGFLHLQEGVDGRLECAGTPLRTDPASGVMTGWAREEGSGALSFYYFPPSPGRRVYSFLSAREALDWVESISLTSLCSVANVFPNGTLASLLGTGGRPLAIGVRPGVLVEWNDTMGRHYGMADRSFTLVETPGPAGGNCSRYGQFADVMPGPRCAIDMTGLLSRYRVVPAMGMMPDSYAAFRGATLDTYHE